MLDELRGLELPEDEPMPYLEVKVKLSEPEPMLRQQVEEILEGKPVRLARIVSFYRQAAEGSRGRRSPDRRITGDESLTDCESNL